jgi:hypothetical protein
MIALAHDRVWRDIGYAVRATPGNLDADGKAHLVDVQVFEIACTDDSGKPLFALKGSTQGGVEWTEKIAEAEVFLTAEIKWDGAAHLWPGEYWHIGGRRDAQNIGAMLVALYQLAADLMPEHAEDLE